MDASEKVNILLVDDQPGRLLTYESILAELGQNLVCAGSGLEALEKLMKEEFAVVLLDVSMPGMDGFEAASLIHEHPRFEKTPIIFVTGVHVSELDRLKGYKLGAVDYVSIPVVPEILRSKVSVLVELYCKRRALKAANRSLAQVNTRLAEANSTLLGEKTRELEALNLTLQRANLELAEANQSLQTQIAERARAELALKEADRQKDEFLAMLAHELRNPLAPILNAVQLMRYKQIEDPQLVWSRDIIARQLAHLTRLVDDLLDVSRITRGKIKLATEPTEISGLIARALEATHPLIAERAHELTVEVTGEPLHVLGDPTRLTQALGNILSNAAKYTERGGHIAIRVHREGGEVVLRVTDTGEGIPANLLPEIFNLFTQLERTSGRSQGGLGIGLALVRRLVEMHGGTVTAHSDGIAKGSEFVIRLPVHEPQPEAADSASGPAVEAARPGSVEAGKIAGAGQPGRVGAAHNERSGARRAPQAAGDATATRLTSARQGAGDRRMRAAPGARASAGVAVDVTDDLKKEKPNGVGLQKTISVDDGSERGGEVSRDVLGGGVGTGEPVRRRILLADDNSDALESLATLLELGGHEVVTASNGALALECAEKHRPEIMLLDIGMPMVDGYEVARRIRVEPWGRRITLVALTGWGQDSDRRRSREAGFDSHLVKPLDMDKLSRLLSSLPPPPAAAPAAESGT